MALKNQQWRITQKLMTRPGKSNTLGVVPEENLCANIFVRLESVATLCQPQFTLTRTTGSSMLTQEQRLQTKSFRVSTKLRPQ